MPKKDKRCKNNHAGNNNSKELILPEDGQTYGNVIKALGNRRFEVQCQDGLSRKCQVRGNMRNRKFVNIGDVVIACLRDFQDDKGDIVHVYNNDEIRLLKTTGKLLLEVKQKKEDSENEDENGFDFESI